MKITAKINSGIKYQPMLISELEGIDFPDLEINNSPTCGIVRDGNFVFGLSKWVSPKRTRSYPYERVYNTLQCSKRITVIPIIKDEGKNGDRDYIQWDTVSLMSLLDVFVIFAYYDQAEKHLTRENKVAKQKFDNDLIVSKINQIKNYHSSAIHWNLEEVKKAFPLLIQKAKSSYDKIGKQLCVEFHSDKGIDKFAKQFIDGAEKFKDISRQKAKNAQSREVQTIQPKEVLFVDTKATITIKNLLGGCYYFTVDEVKLEKEQVFLIESKHSKSKLLPNEIDIKDGLLKMILYTNIEDVHVDGTRYESVPVIRLTSPRLRGMVSSEKSDDEIARFISLQDFSEKEKQIMGSVFDESRKNNFLAIIQQAK